MDWKVFLTMIAVSAISVAVIYFIHKKQFTALGQTHCRWYTVPSLIGIGFMSGYTVVAVYLYSTTLTPNHAGLVCVGIALGGFHLIYGRTAIGSEGVFWGGRLIPWKVIHNNRLVERSRNRLQWNFLWTSSPGVAGDKTLAIVIPASKRAQAERIIRDILPTDGTEKETR